MGCQHLPCWLPAPGTGTSCSPSGHTPGDHKDNTGVYQSVPQVCQLFGGGGEVSSPCRPSHWQLGCWPRTTSPARHRSPHGNPRSSRWCQHRRWRSAVSRPAPWSHAHTPGRWCHRVEQGRLRWQKVKWTPQCCSRGTGWSNGNVKLNIRWYF